MPVLPRLIEPRSHLYHSHVTAMVHVQEDLGSPRKLSASHK